MTGVGGHSAPDLRAARGLLVGERHDSTFLDPARAQIAVTMRPDVRLGHIGTPASWNSWQEGKEPTVARLKGEPALQKILDGLGQSEIDSPRNNGYARGIESESGVHIEGIDRQILRIRRLTDANEIRAAVKNLAADLPTLSKAANGIAANLDDSHSPIIQRIAQSIADQLDQLIRKLEGVNINTVDCDALAKIFDAFSWRMETSFSAEGTSEQLTIRTSPLLQESAYQLIDFLKTRGRIIRADEHGHGAIFELPLGQNFWTRQSSYTRAEFSAVLRLLGWGMMADRAQTVKVVRDKDGTPQKDRSGMIYLTRTRPLPAIYVRLDFSAGTGLPEVPETAKPAK